MEDGTLSREGSWVSPSRSFSLVTLIAHWETSVGPEVESIALSTLLFYLHSCLEVRSCSAPNHGLTEAVVLF